MVKGRQAFAWRAFLKQFSRELLKDVRIREELPSDVVALKWLGYEGASEEEIADLERRLGKRLPPSYRSFLATSNGWRNSGAFIYRLWPCSEVRWFRERKQDWIDAYVDPEREHELSDEEYFVYGDSQNPCRFRTRYLQSALELSDVGDSAIYLLNPEIVADDGEWEAWFFANWNPGADRYRSFRDMMLAERESFRRLYARRGPGQSKYGNAAQQAARRGETGRAIPALRKRADGGDDASALSLAELCAFRGLWQEVIHYGGRFIRNPRAVPDEQAFHEMLRLLGRAGHGTGKWKDISDVADAAIVAEGQRDYDQHHEYQQEATLRFFRNLRAYCKRKGRPPHELIRIFGHTDCLDACTEDEMRAHYRKGVENAQNLQPDELAIAMFTMATSFRQDDEIIRLYEQHGSLIHFDRALDVSRAYMKRGNAEAAWEALRVRMHESVGRNPAQVAPVILLIDEALRPLMTPECCAFVLSTPRGRELQRG